MALPDLRAAVIMQWPPGYCKVILEAGDESVVHSGGKGGFSQIRDIPAPRASLEDLPAPKANSDDLPVSMDDETLSPYLDWAERADFSGLSEEQ